MYNVNMTYFSFEIMHFFNSLIRIQIKDFATLFYHFRLGQLVTTNKNILYFLSLFSDPKLRLQFTEMTLSKGETIKANVRTSP